MKGVILAGGTGSRLGMPYNKHAAPVYDKPMIEYPLHTMREAGADHIIIVSTPSGVGELAGTIEDSTDIEYRVQEEPKGMADALGQAAIKGNFLVLCGDVYFDRPLPKSDKPALIYAEFEGAQNHTVWNPETNELVEKPKQDIGKRAVVAYYFDDRVFDLIRDVQPSKRGELELIDIYRYYLDNGAEMLEYTGFFGDMGTPDGLLRVANHEASL